MKSLTRTAYRAIAAFVAAAFVMIGLASPAFADGATVTITNQRTGIVYTDVATATKEGPVETPLCSARATTHSIT